MMSRWNIECCACGRKELGESTDAGQIEVDQAKRGWMYVPYTKSKLCPYCMSNILAHTRKDRIAS